MNITHAVLAVALIHLLPAESLPAPEPVRLAMKVTYDLVHPLHRVKGISTNGVFSVTFGEGGTLRTLSARIPVADFNSGNDNRDSHALEAVESIRFPHVGFQSTRIEKAGTGFRLTGPLHFHGVSREVQVTLLPTAVGSPVFTGSFQILLSDHGVPRPALLFLISEDRLTLKIEGRLTGSN